MHACRSNNIYIISTDCKKSTTGFSLGYSLKKYGDHGSLLKIENSTGHHIEIDRMELFDGFNQQCELDNWGPEGETISAKSYFNFITSKCKPERIFKYLFLKGE